MKRFLLIIFLPMFIFALSCSDKGKEWPLVNKNTISAKWKVTSEKYEFFEFTKNKDFIVAGKSVERGVLPVVHHGEYQIINDDIKMEGFGIIVAELLKDNNFNFILKPEGSEEEIIFTSKKATEVSSSTNTDLLCKTWVCKTKNGESVTGTNNEFTAVYSRACTFLRNYPDSATMLAIWRWLDDGQTKLRYNDTVYVNITELTDKKLKIEEIIQNDTIKLEFAPK